jgi:hypothetical protein
MKVKIRLRLYDASSAIRLNHANADEKMEVLLLISQQAQVIKLILK